MMDAKLLLLLFIGISTYYGICLSATLRRTPKVYNALITTDENLTSSRAYPVIQPTIHESGIAHYPLGPYNPYGFYSPPVVRFGQPIAPGLVARGQVGYPYPQAQFPPQFIPRPHGDPAHGFIGYHPSGPGALPTGPQIPTDVGPQIKEGTVITGPQPDIVTPGKEGNNVALSTPTGPQAVSGEKLPLPLNEFGLPPALIPLPQYANRNRNPVNLPPYGYNQYPLIFDPVTGFREQYLPPYEYFPGHPYGVHNKKVIPQPTQSPLAIATNISPVVETTETDAASTTITETVTDFESIKNGSKSEDSAVPDVPPPPIPSGAKAQES